MIRLIGSIEHLIVISVQRAVSEEKASIGVALKRLVLHEDKVREGT